MRGDGGASKLLERVRRRVGEELSMPPRRCEEHYRHELKYLISYGQKADLNLRLAPLLEQDSHARGGCHGGQVWPAGAVGMVAKNERNYGKKIINNHCTAIVSGGTGTWGYKFRTQGRTEIVCVEITTEKEM